MFEFTHPSRAVEGLIPDGDPNGRRDRGEAGTIYSGSYEAVKSLEVAFAFNLTRGCINAVCSAGGGLDQTPNRLEFYC